MKEKVVLGLSGGVDSAVAAALLKGNYTVYCLYLEIGAGGNDASDAEAVSQKLDLPLQIVDIREALERNVCSNFAAEYLRGRTPLPCARCNPLVKFPALLRYADEIGAEWVATGHYARTGIEKGRALLRQGLEPNDQSYMLARLPQDILRRTIFPLGEYNKQAVRKIAEKQGISVANKPDSMEICFIPDNDYAAWLDRRGATPPPGDFVDPQGNVLGRHEGIHHYTIGQGRGLGVSGPHRYFVSAIHPENNTVTLSDGSDLGARRVLCSAPNWIAVETLTEPMEVTVRLRHSRTWEQGVIRPWGDGVEVLLDKPARAPTPGQLAVFYRGDQVVGSAWIEKGGSL